MICAHTLACNWQQPFLNKSVEGRDYFYHLLITGPRSRPTESWSWSGSKRFDTDTLILMCSWKKFWKSYFWKKSADDNKSMKNYPACIEFKKILLYQIYIIYIQTIKHYMLSFCFNYHINKIFFNAFQLQNSSVL